MEFTLGITKLSIQFQLELELRLQFQLEEMAIKPLRTGVVNMKHSAVITRETEIVKDEKTEKFGDVK